MLRTELIDMIYEELFNELHKRGHKDPKGRELMKGEDDLEEAINKSDAKYTMKMMFDNHGFGKALKHMKILRKGITLNMSSYMGPGKVLNKIVKDFNEVMGTKFKIDVDSFQKGHVTSIELKEGLNEDYSQRASNFRVALRRRLSSMKKGKKIKYGKLSWTSLGNGNFKDSKGRTVPDENIVQDLKFAVQSDIMKHRGARGDDMVDAYLKFEGKVKESYVRDADTPGYFSPWSSEYKKDKKLKKEMSATARKHGKFGGTGVPFPTEEPNEFAYMDFAKYVKKNEKKMLKFLKPIRPDAMFKALQDLWRGWDRKANKGAFSNIKGNKFGRELALMLRKDGLLFKNTGNKITNLKETDMKLRKIAEATNLWKHFDAKMKLQDTIMDVEDEMRDITNDLKQLHIDMEQEAEPGGGPKATRYGREIEKKEKEYKKKKAEFKKLMAKLDRMEQY